MRLVRYTLFSLLVILAITSGGLLAQGPFPAQIQAAFQQLGIWPYGVYTDGSVPVWNTASNKFLPGGGSGGPVTAASFRAAATTTCAAPQFTLTGSLTTGTAVTSTPSVLTCVSGVAVQTATATGWTTTVPVRAPNGTAGAPALTAAGDTTKGIHFAVAGGVTVAVSSTNIGVFAGTGLNVGPLALGFAGGDPAVTSIDASITREAANHIFQRRTTNAQRLSIANTYASTTSYEAFSLDAQTVANVWLAGSRTAATGTSRVVVFGSQADNGANAYAAVRTHAGSLPFIQSGLISNAGVNTTTATTGTFFSYGNVTSTASSSTVVLNEFKSTINQSGSAGWTAIAIPITETANGSGARTYLEFLGGAAGTTSKTRFDNTGKAVTYDTVATAGQGFDVVRAQATTGTVTNSGTASIATWTPGAADVEVEVGCRVNITVSTTHSFSCDVTYTDVANNARTRVLPMFPINGNQLTNSLMTNTVGTGDYASTVMRIGVKASTAIVVRTSAGGTFTTVTYTASGSIKQVG